MSDWKTWRETYKISQLNPDTMKREMMTTKEFEDNYYEKKLRCKEVLESIREQLAEYKSWPGDYMKGKIRLLEEDLIAWEDYKKRLYAAPPGECVWFDQKLKRNYYWM